MILEVGDWVLVQHGLDSGLEITLAGEPTIIRMVEAESVLRLE